ncbi:MAG: Iron ABC transporter permease [Burkholderia sp.]|jgi:iron complex transport system permease protein
MGAPGASLAADRAARARFARRMAAALLLTLLAALWALCAGRYPIAPDAVLQLLAGADGLPEPARSIVLNVRLPRIALALLAGLALAVSGCAFQAVFSNPLAAPDTLGVATGASFGAVLGILFGFSGLGVQLLALASGLSAAFLVIAVSRAGRPGSLLMVVLSGIAVGALFAALVAIVKYVADPQDELPAITFWLMGSLAGAGWDELAAGAPLIALGAIVLFAMRWRLNALSLPEEEAASLGIPLRRLRLAAIFAATLVTASAVSMCGLIGWIGLLVPHAARMLAGSDCRRSLPASALLGAFFMLIADTLARTLTAGEIPVSVITALAGAPFFILLLRRTGGLAGD